MSAAGCVVSRIARASRRLQTRAMTWLRTSLLLWTIVSGGVAFFPSTEHPKILHLGVCGAVGQTPAWYAACQAEVAKADAATTLPVFDDLLVPRLIIIGAGYPVIVMSLGKSSGASRQTARRSG
jgi:hypothetical protein